MPINKQKHLINAPRAPSMGRLTDLEAAREARIGQKLKPVTIDVNKIRAEEMQRIDRVLELLHKNI